MNLSTKEKSRKQIDMMQKNNETNMETIEVIKRAEQIPIYKKYAEKRKQTNKTMRVPPQDKNLLSSKRKYSEPQINISSSIAADITSANKKLKRQKTLDMEIGNLPPPNLTPSSGGREKFMFEKEQNVVAAAAAASPAAPATATSTTDN